MELFTTEDKKALRLMSKYMQSLGISSGQIDFSFYDGDSDVDLSQEVPFGSRSTQTFSNHYNVEIPEFLYPIIDKILLYCNGKTDFGGDIDVDYFNYFRLEIEIDVERKQVSATAYCGYYEAGDVDGTTWEASEDEEVKRLMDILSEEQESEILYLKYNGSGDSGFIEESFDGGEQVPKEVEQWCYDQLESLHGGWEINEGSDGSFEFDLRNGIINLNHTMNTEVDKQDTIFEESFGKK